MISTWLTADGEAWWRKRIKLVASSIGVGLLALLLVGLASLAIPMNAGVMGLLFLPIVGFSAWLTIRLLRQEHQFPFKSEEGFTKSAVRRIKRLPSKSTAANALEIILQQPGISLSELGLRINGGNAKVRYHIQRMVSQGLVRTKRDSRGRGQIRVYPCGVEKGTNIGAILLAALSQGPTTILELVRCTGLRPRPISREIRRLEVMGLVDKVDFTTYRITVEGTHRTGFGNLNHPIGSRQTSKENTADEGGQALSGAPDFWMPRQ